MTRRLGGIGRRGTTALTSLSLAVTLGCGLVAAGCGDDTSTTTPPAGDAGGDVVTPVDSGVVDAPVDHNTVGDASDGGVHNDATPDGQTVDASDAGDATLDNNVVPETGTPEAEAGPVLPACPTPTITPASGSVAQGTNFVITATGLPTTGGYIFYTSDNSLPSDHSTIYNAGAVGVAIDRTETIHAISSTLGVSCIDSPAVVASYTLQVPEAGPPEAGPDVVDSGVVIVPPAVPTFTPDPSTNGTQANDFTVTMSDTTSSATICYTIGTATPTCTTTATTATCSGGSLTYSAPVTVNTALTTSGSVEIQAVACVPGAAQSGARTAQYTLQVGTPSMTPTAGAYPVATAPMGALSTPTAGATIYYTSNGNIPSCTAPVAGQATYSGTFALQSATYHAIACKSGYLDSVAMNPAPAYTINLAPPTITPAAGTITAPLSSFAVANGTGNPSASWTCATASANGATGAGPVCGTTVNACTTGTVNGAPTAIADGDQIQAIACSAAGLTQSSVVTQGPYKLQLGSPFLTVDGTAATTSSAVPAANLTAKWAASPALAADWLCWAKNPASTLLPGCGASANTCSNTTQAAITVNNTSIFGLAAAVAGDSIALTACSGSGYEPNTTITTFTGAGQAPPPNVSPVTTNPAYQPILPTLTNVSASAMTLCYTTNGTAPTCTPGATTGGCASVGGTATETIAYTMAQAGAGYTVAPFVTLSANGGGSCTGIPVATLASGAVSGITGGTCAGSLLPPTVNINLGSGLTATAAVTQTVTFNVTAPGTGYSAAPIVTLSGPTATLTGTQTCSAITVSGGNYVESAGGLVSFSITSAQLAAACTDLFTGSPTVASITTGGGGTGATATSTLASAQSVALSVTGGGSYYTVLPAISFTRHAPLAVGTCTVTGTITPATGAVATLTATNCSGFSDKAPTVTVTNPTAPTTPASAIAVTSNSLAVPTLEANPAPTLKAVACNAGLSTSPVSSATYTFQQPRIRVGYTTPTVAFAEHGSGPISGADTIKLTTLNATGASGGPTVTAGFTDTKIVYTTDGVNVPNCVGGGTAVTGTSVTIPTPTAGNAVVVNAIACGANQNQVSAASGFITYTASSVENPVVTSMAGGTDLSAGGPGAITGQNLATVTVASASTGAYFCYSLTGATPTCSGTTASACGAGTKLSGSLSPVSGSVLNVVACVANANSATAAGTPNYSSAVVGPFTYTFGVTPAALVGSYAATCPDSIAFGFDPAATPTNGGPTTGATICYNTSAVTTCTPGGGVTCFTPTTGSPTTAIAVPWNASKTIYYMECGPTVAFNSNTGSIPLTGTALYTPPVISLVDGTTTDWTSTELVAGSVSSLTGGFTYDGSGNLFFITKGITTAAAKSLVLYFSDGTATSSATAITTGIAAYGGGTLPFPAQHAIVTATTGGTAGQGVGYSVTAGAWAADGTFDSTGGSPNVTSSLPGGTAWEVEVLGTAIPTVASTTHTVNVAGVVVTGVGATPVLNSWWPQYSGALGYVSDNLANCTTPAGSVK